MRLLFFYNFRKPNYDLLQNVTVQGFILNIWLRTSLQNLSCLYQGKNVYCPSIETFYLTRLLFTFLKGKYIRQSKSETMTKVGKSHFFKRSQCAVLVDTQNERLTAQCMRKIRSSFLLAPQKKTPSPLSIIPPHNFDSC